MEKDPFVPLPILLTKIKNSFTHTIKITAKIKGDHQDFASFFGFLFTFSSIRSHCSISSVIDIISFDILNLVFMIFLKFEGGCNINGQL